MSTFSTFLFARPSFFEGCARVLDFGNTLQEYNQSATPQEADFRAIVADWSAVGEEIQLALDTAPKQQGSSRDKTLAKETATKR